MTIDYDRLMALEIPPVEHTYTQRDTILYALGIGFGSDPTDEAQLRHVYEKDLAAFPTMAVLLGFVSLRELDLGITYAQVVHAEQGLTMHAELPAAGTVLAQLRVSEIIDRGEKGALIRLDRTVTQKGSGRLLAEVRQTVWCRADGGFGGPVRTAPNPHPIPERTCDVIQCMTTLPQQALIYRLSGDTNPLHAEPRAAATAGFPRPILHGLATFGLVGRAVVAGLLAGDSGALQALEGRFSAPVYPGETLEVQLWRDGDEVSLRARVIERDKVVFNNGRARVRAR